MLELILPTALQFVHGSQQVIFAQERLVEVPGELLTLQNQFLLAFVGNQGFEEKVVQADEVIPVSNGRGLICRARVGNEIRAFSIVPGTG